MRACCRTLAPCFGRVGNRQKGDTVRAFESRRSPEQRTRRRGIRREPWVVGFSVLVIVLLFGSCGSSSAPTSASSASGSTTIEASPKLIPAPSGESWGYIHADGTWAIKPQFVQVGYFSDGLAPVEVGYLWGYINEVGNMVIKAQYPDAHGFKGGLARVATARSFSSGQPTTYGWIDKTGKFVIPATWDQAGDFYEGLAAVSKGSAFGYIDTKGSVAIPLKFQNGGHFSEGLACAASGGKWGYIDKKGSWVIFPKYGVLQRNFPGPDGTVNAETLYEPEVFPAYTGVERFHEGYAAVWDSGYFIGSNANRCYFIDKTGKMAFGRAYEAAGEFSEGLALVRVEGKWGFIDTSGHMVIQPRFGQGVDASYYLLETYGFSDGLAPAYRDNSQQALGYIDNTGRWVIQPKYLSGSPFKGGLAYVISGPTGLTADEILAKDGHIVYRNIATPSTASTSAK